MLVQYPLKLCECDLYNLRGMMLNYYLPTQPLKTSGACTKITERGYIIHDDRLAFHTDPSYNDD